MTHARVLLGYVLVVGGGPAGLTAARVAAEQGARTLVLERATHPRYKTCGGGLIGASLAALPAGFTPPVADRVDRLEVTLRGERGFTRTADAGGLVSLVRRSEFDTALRDAAVAAGASMREQATVRSVEQDDDEVRVRLADGGTVRAAHVVGADGSAGVTARAVGVTFDQVDLGLELEVPVPLALQERWRHRILLDWGPLPGSYGWVFPKGDVLTVGVIAARGLGAATRAYLNDFVASLGLGGITPLHDSGHLTRCRAADSPLRRGRIVVAGDAAGLLEPWTREGISFALRSGALAGTAAARGDLAGYVAAVSSTLEPELSAARQFYRVFQHRPATFHRLLASAPGWSWFARFCRGEATFAGVIRHRSVRAALAVLS